MCQRVLSAVIGAPLVFAVIWFGEPWFTILVALVALAAALEFYRMAPTPVSLLLVFFSMAWIALFIISPHVHDPRVLPSLISSMAILPLIVLTLRMRSDSSSMEWAWSICAILYLGWLLSHLVSLRGLVDGRGWVMLAVFATFAADTMAFFVGRAIGKHRMAPAISPGKTWEGAIAGFVAAAIASLILGLVFNIHASYLHFLVIGVLIGVFAQVGDLVESMLKRSAGLKDAGALIPGHGGILDRLDSIVFSSVVLYYYLVWLVL